ncbi:glycoside hydrolase family 92 protein [Luteolibacter pohnpeiensis]|uniref:Glycoside hydrolase family 92 protein n=1 Tax=Luteolibacter pohnpeiensis TaxID=454153 RepID=A0A934VT90_9BACT|nr:glycoside hydrolase domain-containing protein [Luteolibacter pohnpeiensis]MBK1881242.1 glycoside hydrolase family 92 protein [Luteolibacter pohnpeiensis]
MIERPNDLPNHSRVDPFIGCEAADLPKPEGIAATWWRAKPPIGNTHPGACLPFGMVSACAYSGAYVSGYGRYGLSLSGGAPPVMFEKNEAIGIAHFQQSGTGRIRMYYNYLLTTPLGKGGLDERLMRRELVQEKAWPGYYGGQFQADGIGFEVTATERGAVHRYHFPESIEPTVVVDVSAGGLLVDDMGTYPQAAEFRILEDGSVAGHVVMEGIPLHFRCVGEGHAFLWEEEEQIDDQTYELTLEKQKYRPTFGFGFSGGNGRQMELSFGFSVQSSMRANDAMPGCGLVSAARDAAERWEGALAKIEVEGGTDEQRQVFATALYHATLKPAEFTDENPFTGKSGPFFFDLSTLWDLYKTQLPLLMTLWPERGARFVEFLCEVAAREGGFPISYLMDNVPDRFTKQATGLCHAILEDARVRGIQADWDRVLSLLWKTSQSGKGRKSRFGEYGRSYVVNPLSHTLDIAYAHFCMARMARTVGHQVIHDRASALSVHWRNAFDPATGLLREDSTYYEGENWNYSFRLLHDMRARIELAGGEGRFVQLLDKFFGFAEPGHGERIFRFEGLNNEPDMEAPFAYLYAGRHDRTARIVRRVMDHQFTIGPGGLPGNEDSGGLSSWYVWNAIGLFPVCGQPLMLIGSPLFDAAKIQLPDGEFTILVEGNSRENVFIQKAVLNGDEIGRSWLKIGELCGGGCLHLTMGPEPSEFGMKERPPSFFS